MVEYGSLIFFYYYVFFQCFLLLTSTYLFYIIYLVMYLFISHQIPLIITPIAWEMNRQPPRLLLPRRDNSSRKIRHRMFMRSDEHPDTCFSRLIAAEETRWNRQLISLWKQWIEYLDFASFVAVTYTRMSCFKILLYYYYIFF